MRCLATCLLSVVLVSPPSGASAQALTDQPAHRPRQTHLYVGMWSTHLNANRLHIDSNNLMLGLTHGPVFATTFVNSFGNRAYAAGFQHAVVSGTSGAASASLGFRIGAISGYDERFLSFAKDTPVLPMVSAYSLFERKRLGVEVSWTLVVASAAVCIRF